MKRRDFSLRLSSALAAGTLVLPMAQAQTAAPSTGPGKPPEAGTDFLPLAKPAPVDTPAGKIEVIEFFSYDCPHCNAFEPSFDAWITRAPKDVAVKRAPVPFMGALERRQRLYYTLEAMGLVDKLHAKVFHAIHVEHLALDSDNALAEWAAKQGVDKVKFAEQFSSFTVASKVRRATQMTSEYKVEGVPAMGVAGRFYTDGTLAKGAERVLPVVDFLVGEVRKGR
jgi:thiol:disulfide interchange protein DsbA